jgi:hypothetical protein
MSDNGAPASPIESPVISSPAAKPRSSTADAAGIPRLIYLGRVLALCFYPLVAVILGDFVLLLVPQAREALLAFGDGPLFATQAVAFEVAFVVWMISAWYVARLLVGRHENPRWQWRGSGGAMSTNSLEIHGTE